jgi:phosphoribosylaminoimidazole-succinocarboxamide synthase
MIPGPVITSTDLPLPVFSRGKVRDTYELDGDRLLMVATDRISAFDHVLPTGIPDKGRVLTQISIWWFAQTDSFQENHLVSGMIPDLPQELRDRRDELAGRFMIVNKAKRIDIECVVRGYIAGSAWAEYRESGTLAGERLPEGLRESQKLDRPVFSPATKEDSGHDQNITFEQVERMVGADVAAKLRDASLELYNKGSELAWQRGLILADTKFEFGFVGNRVVLIDELLTPDSSRYWDAVLYQPGTSPPSYDKQYVRDWLQQSGWDRNPPAPELPPDVVEQTRERYLTAYRQVTGRDLYAKERV